MSEPEAVADRKKAALDPGLDDPTLGEDDPVDLENPGLPRHGETGACLRCGQPGYATWRICADKNRPRWICSACDVELNETVMLWAFGDTPETRHVLKNYRRRVRTRERSAQRAVTSTNKTPQPET